jgi:hypothetical protein
MPSVQELLYSEKSQVSIKTMFSADPTSLTREKASYQKELAARAKLPNYPFQTPKDKKVALNAMRRQDVLDSIAPAAEKREKVLEKRGIMEGLSGTPLPPDVNDLIGTFATGIKRKPKPVVMPGGRPTKRAKRRARTQKRRVRK